MSKAFTRESDDLPERPTLPRPSSLLPPGVKNYLTPDGARRLREELDRAMATERPKAGASPGSSESRQPLVSLDHRIQQLQQYLHIAEVVEPPAQPWNQVHFGATVTVRDDNGDESRYRIVGAAETDVDRGWVSWLSPIAKALLNARLGQRVRFRSPAGDELLEVVNISYE